MEIVCLIVSKFFRVTSSRIGTALSRKSGSSLRTISIVSVFIILALVAALQLGYAATTITPSSATSRWLVETVDPSTGPGQSSSLVLDASGNPHISYFDWKNQDLKYAVKTGNTWSIENVDAAGSLGEYSSLALDSSGNPHISYYDSQVDVGNGDLKYAVKSGGGVWFIETVDSAGDLGRYNSLVLDASGNPHIAYKSTLTTDVKYAVKSSDGKWTIETVASRAGSFVILALDSSGNPHIIYQQIDSSLLNYAVKTGGVWTIETIDRTYGRPSLVLDTSDRPHITYIDYFRDYLKYAVKSTSGNWTVEIINSTKAHYGNSMALDSSGNPHIIYDSSLTTLSYATKSGGKWIIELVDTNENNGGHYSLALDSSGKPHVSYYNFKYVNNSFDKSYFKHATRSSSAVPTTTTTTTTKTTTTVTSSSTTTTTRTTTTITINPPHSNPPAYTLSWQGYDYNNQGEVSVLVNNQLVATLPASLSLQNVKVYTNISLNISGYVVDGGNSLTFRQSIYSSGVRSVKVTGPNDTVIYSNSTHYNLWMGGRQSITYKFNTPSITTTPPPPITEPDVSVSTFNVRDGKQKVFNSTDTVRVGVKASGSLASVQSVKLSTTGSAGYTGLSDVPMIRSGATGSAWLSEWGYRKAHAINAVADAGTNYQVRVVVHRGSGADSRENVYLNNRSLSWSNDIRFTSLDGTTNLDYWLESSDGNTAVFWVEVKDDLSSMGTTIFIYYGKLGASSASNGDNTFVFFDDFDGSTFDSSKWNAPHYADAGTSASLHDGLLDFKVSSGYYWTGGAIISKDPLLTRSYAVTTKLKMTNFYDSALGAYAGFTNAVIYKDKYYGAPADLISAVLADYTQAHQYLRVYASGLPWGQESGYITVRIRESWFRMTTVYTPTTYVEGNWEQLESPFTTETLQGKLTGGFAPLYITLGIGDYETSEHTYYDYVFARKHALSEPLQGSWGSEEKPTSSYSNAPFYNYFYDYTLPSVPPGAYNATVSVKLSNGLTKSYAYRFESMSQTITENGPWTAKAGANSIPLSFNITSSGSKSNDTNLFIDLPSFAVVSSATVDSQHWTLKTGTGAPAGYTRYYAPYIYVGTGKTREVVFQVKISSTATLGNYTVRYFSDWKTYEGYQYVTRDDAPPGIWVPKTMPDGRSVRVQSVSTTPYGAGWSVTSGGGVYDYEFMGWTSSRTWKVPGDGKITVSGAFLKYDNIPETNPWINLSYVKVYVLNQAGTSILGSAYAATETDQRNVWYVRNITIAGLTPGENISIGIGRRDEGYVEYTFNAKWTGIHINTYLDILRVE